MSAPTLVRPVLSLVGWTFAMEVWLYATRIPAFSKYKIQISPSATKQDMDRQLPPEVRWKASAYDHLHEAPTRFYAIGLGLALLQVQGSLPSNAMELETNLAWAYVGLRVVHSLVYAINNKILVRFGLYLLSEFVMLGMFARAVTYVF